MQLKPVDKDQKIYHLFKLSDIKYALYDDEMDMPIQYGSLTIVYPAVQSIKKHVKGITVIYYDRDLSDKMTFKKNPLKTRINNQ